jgi:hypothetical protein
MCIYSAGWQAAVPLLDCHTHTTDWLINAALVAKIRRALFIKAVVGNIGLFTVVNSPTYRRLLIIPNHQIGKKNFTSGAVDVTKPLEMDGFSGSLHKKETA